LAEQLIAHLGYIGIALILILGGLGLPIPEEAPVILAAVLSRNGKMLAPLAFATCLAGVLLGDFVVYFLGYWHGERVLSLRLTRRLLTRGREAQIKGYFHRHGFKILILGRFAVGFRTAAYLTAGILKLPPWKLFFTDLVAASLSTSLMFGLAYVFADKIQSGIREFQEYLTMVIAVGVAAWLGYRYYKGRKSAGLPVGPPVLIEDEAPLPEDDAPTVSQVREFEPRPQLPDHGASDASLPAEPTSPPAPPPPLPHAVPASNTKSAVGHENGPTAPAAGSGPGPVALGSRAEAPLESQTR
jgi:membrane protein DedA with SNARE-associated domain